MVEMSLIWTMFFVAAATSAYFSYIKYRNENRPHSWLMITAALVLFAMASILMIVNQENIIPPPHPILHAAILMLVGFGVMLVYGFWEVTQMMRRTSRKRRK